MMSMAFSMVNTMARATDRRSFTCATVSPGVFFMLQSLTHEKMMRQKCLGHLMVPTTPRSHFVVIHSQLALGFGEDRFDRPAHPAQTNHRRQRALYRRIGQENLRHRFFARGADTAAEHRPCFACHSTAFLGSIYPHTCKLCDDTPFRALLDCVTLPLYRRYFLSDRDQLSQR